DRSLRARGVQEALRSLRARVIGLPATQPACPQAEELVARVERPECGCLPDRGPRLRAVTQRRPLACDPVVVASQPGTDPTPADRAHGLGMPDEQALQDARDVLPATEPITAVVGRVPAIAEDRPVDEGRGAAGEQAVAVLDVRLNVETRVELARRLECPPGHECPLKVDGVARK